MKIYSAVIKDLDGKIRVVDNILSESKINVYRRLKQSVKDIRQIISVEDGESVIDLR